MALDLELGQLGERGRRLPRHARGQQVGERQRRLVLDDRRELRAAAGPAQLQHQRLVPAGRLESRDAHAVTSASAATSRSTSSRACTSVTQ